MSLKDKLGGVSQKIRALGKKKLIIIAGGLFLLAVLAVVALMMLGGGGDGRSKLEELADSLHQIEVELIDISGQLIASEDVADSVVIHNAVTGLAGQEETLAALLAFLPEIPELSGEGGSGVSVAGGIITLDKMQAELGDIQSQLAGARGMLQRAVDSSLMEESYMGLAKLRISGLQGDVRKMTSLFYGTKSELMDLLGGMIYHSNDFTQNKSHGAYLEFRTLVEEFGGKLEYLENVNALDHTEIKRHYTDMLKLADDYLKPEGYVVRTQLVLDSVSEQVRVLRARFAPEGVAPGN